MSLSDFRGRILSRPVKVHWAGWETDTLTLQQNGWELSVDQNIARNEMRMVIRHEQLGFIGQSASLPWDFHSGMMEHHYLNAYEGRERFFQMRHMGRSIMIHNHGAMDFSRYSPVDAQPRFTQEAPKELGDLVHFAAPLVRTQALVLPEKTVDQLLADILEAQQDAKTSYFRDMVAREGDTLPAHKFHAQIISFPQAA